MSRNTWKATPPGEEQVKLNSLFQEGKITPSTLPAEAYKMSDIFMRFSLDKFRYHFNDTKRKLGLNCKSQHPVKKQGSLILFPTFYSETIQ